MAKKKQGYIYPKILETETKQVCPTCLIGFIKHDEVYAVRFKGQEIYWHINCLETEMIEAVKLRCAGNKSPPKKPVMLVEKGLEMEDPSAIDEDYDAIEDLLEPHDAGKTDSYLEDTDYVSEYGGY